MQDFNSYSPELEHSSPITMDVQPVIRLVYMWMGLGLLTTAIVATVTWSTPALLALASGPGMLVAMLLSLGLVIGLNAGMNRMSSNVAGFMFFVYAAVLGFFLSTIFITYELGAIYSAFFTTAGLFGVMTIVGFTTKIDLTKYASFFMMAVIGLVIAMVVNIFLRSSGFDLLISMVGVLVFTGLTAYDTQKIKNWALDPRLQKSREMTMKMSIMGALSLYLDFINMFLFLLRIIGGRR